MAKGAHPCEKRSRVALKENKVIVFFRAGQFIAADFNVAAMIALRIIPKFGKDRWS